jgi:hypothetical protein
MTAPDDASQSRAEDAELWAWLERYIFEHKWDGCINRPSSWHMAGPYRHALQKLKGATLREAITAAIRAESEGAAMDDAALIAWLNRQHCVEFSGYSCMEKRDCGCVMDTRIAARLRELSQENERLRDAARVAVKAWDEFGIAYIDAPIDTLRDALAATASKATRGNSG